MSRKHNTKHPNRGRTNEVRGYLKRLHQRGLGKAPMLADVDTLRVRQERRIRETCNLDSNHDGHQCNGVPFPYASELELEMSGVEE